MKSAAMVLALCVVANVASASEVFKCIGANGTTTYSEQPCALNAERVHIQRTAPKQPFDRSLERWCDAGAVAPKLLDRCVAYWKPLLRDPASLSVRGAREVVGADSRERAIFIDLYAKNGFGGNSYMQARCGLDKKSGQFDNTLSREWRSYSIDEPARTKRGFEVESCGPRDINRHR